MHIKRERSAVLPDFATPSSLTALNFLTGKDYLVSQSSAQEQSEYGKVISNGS